MASRRRIRQRFALASHSSHNHRLRRRPALEALEPRVVLSTFTVDLPTDNAPTTGGVGSGLAGDLRYCITQANADNQANTIVFDPAVFGTPLTITLGGSQLELNDTGGWMARESAERRVARRRPAQQGQRRRRAAGRRQMIPLRWLLTRRQCATCRLRATPGTWCTRA